MSRSNAANWSRTVAGHLSCMALVLTGCQGNAVAKAGSADPAAAIAGVRHADSAFLGAATARDLEGSVTSLTTDGVMLPPDAPPVVGRTAIREFMRQAFATPGFSVSWTTDTIIVAASGDLAYSFARSRFTFPGRSRAPGAVDTASAKGVNVWRLEPDGHWRAAIDMWNGSPALPPIHPAASGQ